MKKQKVIIFFLIITFCLLVVGCNKNENTFSLEEKYYKDSTFNELTIEEFNNLINEKESFAVFIYQPLCTASYEFNKVLTEFAKEYQISFYKLSFSDMKQTELGNSIKYYPSLAIYNKGEIVDYLDANSDEDTEFYKSVYGFTEWFSNYVSITKSDNIDDNNNEDEIDENTKIDAKLENIKYDENKINIYFFWGNGCPHCEEEFKFFESIKTEYGDYFTLNTFEVWYNKDNAKLLEQFASAMGDKVTGVPYTIIGNETFSGFSISYERQFLNAIKEQYQNSYDVYFDKSK